MTGRRLALAGVALGTTVLLAWLIRPPRSDDEAGSFSRPTDVPASPAVGAPVAPVPSAASPGSEGPASMPPPPAAPFALAFGSPQQFGRELVALLEKRALDEAERRAGAADPELLRSAMGAREVAVLTDLYRTLPPHGRSLAAWLIAHSPDTGATSALTWSLEREEEEDVRMALARALGRRTEQEAAMALCLRLETDSSPGVRVASAHALAHAAARDPLALRALARCVETDANAAVGAAAATALGQVPSSEAAAALVVGLRSSAVDVRVAAAGALGGHAGRIRPEEVAALEANEKDPRVREALRVAGEALRGELSMPEVEGRPRKKE